MRIGIITILKVNNYGAELQAYATQAALRRLGYDAEIIDYLFYKNPGHIPTPKSAPLFKFPLKKRLAERLYPIIAKMRSSGNGDAAKRRAGRFASFHERNTSMSAIYRTIDDLYGAKLDYDVYLTGSDQVWNPGIYSSVDPYFLGFAPEGCRRVAYAASFGVSSIPEDAREYYGSRLRRYDAIGVREKGAVEMVRGLAGREAQWVLDPTLLLTRDQWTRVASPVGVDQPYILIYELTPCPYIRRLAEHISASKGWKIVRVCKSAAIEDKDGKIDNITDAGPAEFIGLFAQAGYVVTNSFHGTAFALNFGRQFYTVLPLRKQNNSRQRSLLELFGLTSRLLVEGDELPDVAREVDYKAVDARLDSERAKSLKFLKSAIDGRE